MRPLQWYSFCHPLCSEKGKALLEVPHVDNHSESHLIVIPTHSSRPAAWLHAIKIVRWGDVGLLHRILQPSNVRSFGNVMGTVPISFQHGLQVAGTWSRKPKNRAKFRRHCDKFLVG